MTTNSKTMTNFMERQRCIAELLEYARITLRMRYCIDSSTGGFLEVDFFEENDGDMFFEVTHGNKNDSQIRTIHETWRIDSETMMNNMSLADKFAKAEIENSDTTIKKFNKEILPIFLVEVIFGDETFRYIEKDFEEAKHRLRVCIEEKLHTDLVEKLPENYHIDELDFYCREYSDGLFESFEILEITPDLQLESRTF